MFIRPRTVCVDGRTQSTAPTVAITSTRAMVRAAAGLGVDVEAVFHAQGVPMGMLDDPDARLPHPTVLRIWSDLMAQSGDPVGHDHGGGALLTVVSTQRGDQLGQRQPAALPLQRCHAGAV